MKTTWMFVPLALVTLSVSTAHGVTTAAPDEASTRKGSQLQMKDGNYKEAYDAFRRLALDPATDPIQVPDDLNRAVDCLNRLNRIDELDAFREAVIKAHSQNWRLLLAAARSYMDQQHIGFLVAGEFQRGPHRGGGNPVTAEARDRVRALQLMVQAMPLAQQAGTAELVAGRPSNQGVMAEVSAFFQYFGQVLLGERGWTEAWRLQYLTDIAVLPDYEPGWGGYYGGVQGAPVDEQGNPILYSAPPSFEAAANDGQRWRWCLAEAGKYDSRRQPQLQLQFADFLLGQFGVQTMADFGWRFGRQSVDDSKEDTSGTYALHTLSENETIARLATGIKRFTLPDEFNYLKIYEQVADERGPAWHVSTAALSHLVEIFENRRQYPKAAEYCRRLVELYTEMRETRAAKGWQDRLDQIVGNWGRFEPVADQPAGQGATVEYRFRNGSKVQFTAHEIKIDQLLADVKAYLKNRPAELDWRKTDVGDIGYRLVQEGQRQYLGRQVAAWEMELKPRPDHLDNRVTVTTPLSKAGAYLVKAVMADGNTSQIILWVADTAIVKKSLGQRNWYYVADAVTGRPIAKANVELFGYRQEWRNGRRAPLETLDFAEFTDADGQVMPDARDQRDQYQWLVIARTPEGRLAYMGFDGVWYGRYNEQEYRATKLYTITDRPVYRPKQKVNYKFWVAMVNYDQPNRSPFAGRTFTVEIRNPKNEKVVEKQLTADEWGGFAGDFELAEDAALGVWRTLVKDGDRQFGGGSFRVEEYKKPEFEVTVDAPTEPLMLGDKITATIRAKYYFGSPVTQAKVKYKVTRTDHDARWFPIMPWDWLYGPGYWWFGGDYGWYRGWEVWGWHAPRPTWWRTSRMPPEVVAERTVDIGPNGEVKVEIDTELAKLVHPDQDHRYTITAEVTDESRRTIVGDGSVLVARKPFSICTWLDHGYYRVGDVVRAHFDARTLAGKGVTGKGRLALLKITYKDGEPVETPVQTWNLDTDAEGGATQQLTASQAGQYRLAYTLTDAAGHAIEGGYLFTVIGQGFDGRQFRFSQLELVPDKKEYQPDEKVQLQINTDRPGPTVLLFLRPAGGVYLPPKVLRLEGKSTVVPIEVLKKDMPNFFVEAVTVADGRVYTESKQIVVPPEKRILNVAVEPSATAYKPGQKAKVKVRLTNLDGKPFIGSTVISIYDRSVEYIAGGSNAPEIKEFFWKWVRHHQPQTDSNLGRQSDNLVEKGAVAMNDLGIFGGTQIEELLKETNDQGQPRASMLERRRTTFRGRMGGMAGMGGGMGGMAMEGMPAPMAKMALRAPSAAGAEMAAAPVEADAAADVGEAPLVEPTVRTKFADTALWVADLTTKNDGTAEVELDMPENLTTWRIKAWAMGGGTRVGQGQTDVVTRKDLIIRMQTPRFFVQGDRVTLSANVHNYLEKEKQVQISIELDGPQLVTTSELLRTVGIKPGGENRINWWVDCKDEGEAVIRMKALTDEESDAMEMRVPCYVHGMLKTESYSGSIRAGADAGKFTVNVPKDRRPAQSRLEIRYSPTLAGAMVDALPYLVDYPYGCTEQTLSRFLPTVIVQRILISKGIDLKEVEKKRTNLNAQEIGDDAQRAEQWKHYKRNPVFDADEVRRMVKDGVTALTQMQCGDGGWGWFSGWGERSYPHTTAYVVHGLQIAKENDVALVPGVLERGVAWLTRYQDEQIKRLENADRDPKHEKDWPWKRTADNLDAFVYMVLVDAGITNGAMRDYLFRDRTHLAVYSMAMYGLALEKQGEKAKLAMILRNIGQYVQQDDENQTAWLNLPGDYWWCWYGSEYEAQAYYLKLLCRTDPKGELAPRLVKYLLNNRKHATYWNSTRDTAICIEAMADFLKASGEDRPEMTVEVYFDGKLQKAVEITPANLFDFDNKLVLEGDQLATGPHQVELRRKGTGPLYYNAYQTNFTLEDFIKAAGLEIKVQRKYYRLKPVDATVKAAGSRGQAVDQKVEKYERVPLANLAEVTSGDLVEIELEMESKNDYEYLVFEDMKPAGFEPVEVRSGYNGNDLGAYVEFRDNRVVFLVRQLARGRHSVSYRMRAEIPGRFSALPTRGSAMYAPELKANSDEIKLQVVDVVEDTEPVRPQAAITPAGAAGASDKTDARQPATKTLVFTVTQPNQHLGHSTDMGTHIHRHWYDGCYGRLADSGEEFLIFWGTGMGSQIAFEQDATYAIEYRDTLDDGIMSYKGRCLRSANVVKVTKK